MEIKAVITGDIVRSELIALDKRDLLIQVLHQIVENLQDKSPMRMELFRGDSFQIVVDSPEMSLKIASMMRAGLKSNTPKGSKTEWDARISIGIGTIDYRGTALSLLTARLSNFQAGDLTQWRRTDWRLIPAGKM